MIFPRNIHALDHFKRNTAEFRKRLKETGEPAVLTVDGKAELVVMSAEAFEQLLERIEKLETIEAIAEGLTDIKAGRTIPAAKVHEDLRRKLGILRDEELQRRPKSA